MSVATEVPKVRRAAPILGTSNIPIGADTNPYTASGYLFENDQVLERVVGALWHPLRSQFQPATSRFN